MLLSEPLAINFHIPATDPLGREKVFGKLRFLPSSVEVSWRLEGNVFTGGKSPLSVISLPYSEIEHVELVKRWFRYRSLVFRVSDPQLVADMPGVEMGKMTLEIDKRSGEEAKKLDSLIDYQKSIFILDAHEARLENMKLS